MKLSKLLIGASTLGVMAGANANAELPNIDSLAIEAAKNPEPVRRCECKGMTPTEEWFWNRVDHGIFTQDKIDLANELKAREEAELLRANEPKVAPKKIAPKKITPSKIAPKKRAPQSNGGRSK